MAETVYSGPPVLMRSSSAVVEAPASVTETVYDPANHTPRRLDTTIAREAVTKSTKIASIRFFVVAGISFVEFLLYRHGMTAFISLLTCLVFSVIGFHALQLNRKAFLAAIAIYGLSTMLFLIAAFANEGGIFTFAIPIFARATILFRLYKQYTLIGELETLEAT